MEPQKDIQIQTPSSHPTAQQTEKTVAYIKQLLAQNKPFLFNTHTSHIMILYFLLEGLDVLNRIGDIQPLRPQLLDYLYSLQLPNSGFTSSSLHRPTVSTKYDLPHIVFTYSAVNCLAILKDDLKRLNKESLLKSIANCRKPDGSYSSFANSDQADLRFVYAAVAVCKFVGDLSPIDIHQSMGYVQKCYNFDGGFGLRPGCESHTGAVYCAVSLCKLLGTLDKLQKNEILHFLAARQSFNLQCPTLVGVQGRVGKLPDSCYSFWAGASICMLTGKNLLTENIKSFLHICFTKTGSYGKYPEMAKGDPLHTLHSLVGGKIIRGQWEGLSLERGIKTEKVPNFNESV